MSGHRTPSFDRHVLGANIRGWREIRGFSQAELASRAGVGITTIYKAEMGKPVRQSFLERIVRLGLEGSFDECCRAHRVTNVKSPDDLYIKHHRQATRWFIYGDQRRQAPEGNLDLIQDVQERIRLGRLGFATLFGHGLEYLMPNGPGVLVYEVHGPTDPVNQNYRDAIYLALRGSVRLMLRDQVIHLQEGESIGCDGRESVRFDLGAPWITGQMPPLVQFIGANRVGRAPSKSS